MRGARFFASLRMTWRAVSSKCPNSLKFLPGLAERFRRQRRKVATLGPARQWVERNTSDPALARAEPLRQARQARAEIVSPRPLHRPGPHTHGSPLGDGRALWLGRSLGLLLRFAAQVEQQVRDVDLHRAHFAAGAAQRRGKGQLAGALEAGKLGRYQSADGATLDPAVGVPADLPVDRAGVEASVAANTKERLAS